MRDICENWTQWLLETRFSFLTPEMQQQTLRWLETVRDNVLRRVDLQPGETVIDIGTGTGLLAFRALELMSGSGGEVIFSDKFQDCLDSCEKLLQKIGVAQGFRMLLAPCEEIPLETNSVDKAMMRSVLVHIVDKQPAFNEIYRILKPGGRFVAFEPIIRTNTRYWELTTPENIENYEAFKSAENAFMTNPSDPLCNFDEQSISQNLEIAGFSDGSVDLDVIPSRYIVNADMVDKWFSAPPAPDQLTMKERFLKYFDEAVVDKYISDVKADLSGKTITVTTKSLYINVIK